MENHILAERIANAIMMDNSFKGHYLVVEGQKDYKVFSKFIDHVNIRIKEAFGFEKVKLVLQILTERGFSNKIGIIDADFSRILEIEHNLEGLFLTDYHDIEVMIIKTKSLESVLRTFISNTKLQSFEKEKGKTIQELVMELGSEIGFLKLANKVYDLGLVFKPHNPEGNQIDYKDFIDRNSFSYHGKSQLIRTSINYSRNKSSRLKTELEITNALDEIAKQTFEIHDLVNGHDLSNILFLLMKKTLASRNKMLTDFNSVEDCLSLAYDYEDFKETELYKTTKLYADRQSTKLWR